MKADKTPKFIADNPVNSVSKKADEEKPKEKAVGGSAKLRGSKSRGFQSGNQEAVELAKACAELG